MPTTKAYTRVNFENYPSTNTPLNATNLNKVDKGIDDLDDLLVTARNNIETLQQNATTDEAAISDIKSQLSASNQTAGVSNVPFRFGCTDDGKFGYILTQGGADSVIPFKSTQVYYLGTGRSFNIAQKLPNDYQNLTADNFIVITNTSNNGNAGWRWDTESADGNWLWFSQPSKSYNPTTGLLTIGNNTIKSRVSKVWSSNVHENTMTCTSAVYVVIGNIESI